MTKRKEAAEESAKDRVLEAGRIAHRRRMMARLFKNPDCDDHQFAATEKGWGATMWVCAKCSMTVMMK